MSVHSYAKRTGVAARRTTSAGDPEHLTPVQRRVLGLQRTAGNRAAAPVVQRWAWVSASQIMPDAPGLTPRQQAMTKDKVVRDYGSDAEFKDHSEGKTDYLGNLPGPSSTGTWVRFAPSGINLLGENHTLVTLEHVAPAVGTKNFIYEQFATDTMPPGSQMGAAYEKENEALFKKFGVDKDPDKKKYGEESLFPKIGYGMSILVQLLGTPIDYENLKAAAYVGQPAQRYLKIAWGHAADTAAEVARLKSAGKPVPKPLADFAAVYNTLKPTLDAFIKALPVDGYLGDALDTTANRKLSAPVKQFAEAAMAAMLARASADPELSAKDQGELSAMPKGTREEKEAMFGKWRNLHFSKAVHAAAARGVRYAGMGNNHLLYLLAEGLPAGGHDYDMQGKHLADFETLTKNLAASAKNP